MSLINPVGNQVSQPFLSQEHASQQNVTPAVRVGAEGSVIYAPNSAEWVRNNPVAEAKEKEKARQKHIQEKVDQECETCQHRREDESEEVVSLKTSKYTAEQSVTAVFSHEAEHVYRDKAYADMNNKEVLYQRVALQTDICPECGKLYVSGGQASAVAESGTGQEQLEFAVTGNLLDIEA